VATFHGGPWLWYLLWNLAGFGGALILNSFVEWAVHRFVMHKLNPIIPYGYKHVTSHHATFLADETYVAIREDMLEHGVAFTWREYVLFPILCTFLYAPIEILIGRPIMIGALAAVFAGLQAFNMLHYRFHVPQGSWIEKTIVFKFLNRHHLLHHENQARNFNVVVPLADFCLGTLTT
jgi:Fatty acid hydroxylase